MRKFLLTSICLLMALCVQLRAQERMVTGNVTSSDDNSPLPGVSVVVKGTLSGTVTDGSGNYSLRVPNTGKALVFSFVGMEEQEVEIGTKSVVNASLKTSANELSEVVVVGYGVQQRKAFTGAASKVDAKQFANLMTPSIDKQLAGRATGVQVTNVGGGVNTPARIRIRGTNSINQANDPLIVVDGIPIISGNLAQTTNSNTLGDINPADIENMEVLKDGSATAIYGSRAAAGVILITTKKGTKGRGKVNYDAFIGFNNALKRFDLLNAEEFVTIANEKLANAGQPLRANMDANRTNTDWQDQVMVKNATVHNHTLSAQGGSEKTSYYMSLNYSAQQGIIITNYNKAYRARLNVEHEANKFIKVGNNINISRQDDGDQNNGTNALSGAISSSLRLLPNVSPFNPNHPTGFNVNWPNGNSMNPGANTTSVDDNFTNAAYTLRANKYRSDKYRIINNSFVEISPIAGLKVRSVFSADWFNDYSFQSWTNQHGDGYGTSSGGTNGYVYNFSRNQLRYTWQNYLNYNLTLGKNHNIYLTAGHEVQRENNKWHSTTGTNISDMFFVKENFITGSAAIQSVGGSYSESGFESLFGRFNYDFNSKYFVQASIRRDGQSSLAPEKRYGVFPGFSAGWRLSQEGFWASSGLSQHINEVKLKASYAKVGNTLTDFPYLSTYGARPYGNISGIAVSAVGNSDLLWETSNKYDIGLELGILNNRFNITADYFLNDVDNLVLDVPTPLSAGVPNNNIKQNIGALRNKGFELSISGDIIRGKDFGWSANFNYSNVKNRITALYSIGGSQVPYIQNGGYNLIEVGQPINVLHGYQFSGVNSANGNPVYVKADGSLIQLNISNGAPFSIGGYYLAPSQNEGTLGTQSSLTFNDRVKLGNPTPVWFGAFTNNFRYKGLSLEVMLRYSGGNKIFNTTKQEILMNQSFQNNGKEILNRWQKPGDVTNVPKLYYGQGNNINQTQLANSRFIESGDYLRLQNVVLSYSLPTTGLNKITSGFIQSMRVFAQGQNLAVWTKYSGADPDNISTLGLDYAVSPQIRTVSFGLNLGF
ncbi:TonB-dependent receptor [Runella sp. MFBS21]|uniref:SusC/RagA family TonB-linked outer membrane protein n=1 Tax=Runella sp. MFBS21 TaxID=3034018 RepID=UPI0023F849BA|nr:TonB-dependent receptor [Runella sp. MFBS21]MDF7820109.1 TonB-dependent receptor [Runella sp. MFBS21]